MLLLSWSRCILTKFLFGQVYGESEGQDDANDITCSHLYQYPVALRPNTRWTPHSPTIQNSFSSQPSSSTKLTAASLYAHNHAGRLSSLPVVAVDQDDKPSQQRALGPKVLPEIPLSNRKLLLQSLKRNSKVNNNIWSSSLPMVCPSIPPLVPPPRVCLSSDKIQRLNAILAESDSEDERVIIPKTTEGFDIGK